MVPMFPNKLPPVLEVGALDVVPMFPNIPPPVLLAAVFVFPKRLLPLVPVFVVEVLVPPNRGFCVPGLVFPNRDVPPDAGFVFVAELPNNEVAVLPAAGVGAFPNKEDPVAPEL